jgi:hypothetical protein
VLHADHDGRGADLLRGVEQLAHGVAVAGVGRAEGDGDAAELPGLGVQLGALEVEDQEVLAAAGRLLDGGRECGLALGGAGSGDDDGHGGLRGGDGTNGTRCAVARTAVHPMTRGVTRLTSGVSRMS